MHALWDEAAPVTEWRGVRFGEAGGADAGRVVAMDLGGRGLSGNVPAALGRLTALMRLSLNRNRLTSVPATRGELSALKALCLGRNRLTSVPAELGGLTALASLHLHGNQLTSVPAELGGLTALTLLSLSTNLLTSVPAAWEKGGALEQSGCHMVWKGEGEQRMVWN